MHRGRTDDNLMAKIRGGASFISNEIRKNFSSFYLFGDLSTTKKDLVGVNDLTYEVGSPSVYYGPEGRGEKFDGTKKLSNISISPLITAYPMFIYASAIVTDIDVLGNTFISLSPWVTGYTKNIRLVENTGSYRAGGTITETFYNLSNFSKVNPTRFYSIAMRILSTTDFTTFVNGEKLGVYQGYASSVTSRNAVYIGNEAGASSFPLRGGVFSAGWGLKDPGDDFLRRLTLNPNLVIFQKSFKPMKSVSAYTSKQRRTMSPLGTRTGKRQAQS